MVAAIPFLVQMVEVRSGPAPLLLPVLPGQQRTVALVRGRPR